MLSLLLLERENFCIASMIGIRVKSDLEQNHRLFQQIYDQTFTDGRSLDVVMSQPLTDDNTMVKIR